MQENKFISSNASHPIGSLHKDESEVDSEVEIGIDDEPVKRVLPANASKSQKRNARSQLMRRAGGKQDGSEVSLLSTSQSRKRRRSNAAWRDQWDTHGETTGGTSQNMIHTTS